MNIAVFLVTILWLMSIAGVIYFICVANIPLLLLCAFLTWSIYSFLEINS